MSDWVNWQQFAELNAPEVQRRSDDNEMRMAEQQRQMDASLGSLSRDAMSWANAGEGNSLSALGSYGDLMAGAKADAANTPAAQQGAPWDSELGGTSYASPWGKLSEKLGGIQAQAAQRGAEVRGNRAAEQQKAEMKAWDDAQRRAGDSAMNGRRMTEAGQYAAWSDAVNRSAGRTGGIGAGAYYDFAGGKGQSPVMAPSSERTDKVNAIYRRNPSYISSSNFGNTNNAGGTIFTGNWSF